MVHGLVASKHLFWRMERSLRRQGFRTNKWSYWSMRGDVRTLGHSLARHLRLLSDESRVKQLHLVTHSMGSIITRAMLASHEIDKLTRVVNLSPPHRGSRVAANLAPWLGGICPPLHQLSDAATSVVNQLNEPTGIELGVIAAARDRVVAVDSTHITTQTDHTVVNYGHTSMLFRREVSQLVLQFLSTGRFDHQPQQAS